MEPGALAPVRHSPGDGGPLNCVYRDGPHGIFLYQGDCLEVLDAIAAKVYPEEFRGTPTAISQ